MSRKWLYTAVLFLNLTTVAYASPPADSLWFDNYFTRLTYARDLRSPTAYDSLDIVGAMAAKQGYASFICRYYEEKAAWYFTKKLTDSSILAYNSAIAIAEKNHLDLDAGYAYLGLANLQQFSGNTLAAASNYLKAIDYLREQGRKRILFGLYRNLHSVFTKLRQKNVALESMLVAVSANNTDEADLVNIINTTANEQTGLDFPDQSLLKEVGTNGIYVIFGGAKFAVNDFETLGSYGSMRDVQRVPAGTLAQLPNVPVDGTILMELKGDPNAYIIRNGILYHIENPEVLEIYGGWDAVLWAPKNSLKPFPKATELVTMKNVNTIFNFRQAFDHLSDSIRVTLQKNSDYSNRLSHLLANRNTTLQNRKTLVWVFSIGSGALLLIVILLIRNFRQKQKLATQSLIVLKREEELQRIMAVQNERSRIATDMHDDLGAGLSRIKFLSETIGIKKQRQQPIEEDVIRIGEYSNEMINKMGEIVWALDEKNDSLSDLLAFTRAYSIEYLNQNGIECEVTMPEDISQQNLGGELRRNVFLSVKEILHNVVKHSSATSVIMTLEVEDRLRISIYDNGCGFETGSVRPFSNGLMNIRKRMKDVEGSVEIKTNPGTLVRLDIPLNR